MLHVLDRQVEYTSRVDFLWQSKLKVEQEQVETMRGINKILLENILPAHVAEHFLTNMRATQVSPINELTVTDVYANVNHLNTLPIVPFNYKNGSSNELIP